MTEATAPPATRTDGMSSPPVRFTPRERDVPYLLAEGQTDPRITVAPQSGPRSVGVHVGHSLGTHELLNRAVRHHLR